MISDIRLQQFRSYQDDSFEFSPSVNIIVGPNASGKTNLLEALLVIARGSSYRAKDTDLVTFDAPWARLDAHTATGLRTVKLVIEPPATKSYELDEKSYKRLSLQHSLPVVIFEPNHLLLLHGSPDQRRAYLDDLLEQIKPNYGPQLRHYRRTLAQRNALLKRAHRPTNEELFPWNLRLSELGAVIARNRAELVAAINEKISSSYKNISHTQTETEVRYISKFGLESYESTMLHKLETDLTTDIFRGFTAAGPHREDFAVLFDGRLAAETASRGEVRTLVLGLKAIELEILHEARDMKPILLLDDVFSELDGARRRALTEHLASYQTFITTTDADIVLKDFASASTIIPIQKSSD